MLFLKTSCRQRRMAREWKFENAGIDGTMFGVFYSLSIRHSTQSCRRDWEGRRVRGNELRYNSWKTHLCAHTHQKTVNKISWEKLTSIRIRCGCIYVRTQAWQTSPRQTAADSNTPHHTPTHTLVHCDVHSLYIQGNIPNIPITQYQQRCTAHPRT